MAAAATSGDSLAQRLKGVESLLSLALARSAAAVSPNASGLVFIRPTGLPDDRPFLHATMLANAYKKIIVMLPGLAGEHWNLITPGNVPSGTTIWGTPGTIIDATFVGGSLGDGVFNAVGVESGTTIALAASNVVGSDQVSMVSAPTVGAFYLITKADTGNLLGSVYQVTDVTGGGPFTVTLDESVVYSFTSADEAKLLSPSAEYPRGVAEDIRIFGNGMVLNSAISGGSIIIENLCAQNCIYEDLVINEVEVGDQNALTCDTGSRGITVRNLRINCNGPALAGNQGIWCQGNRHTVENCVVRNPSSAIGVTLISSANCLATGNRVYGGSVGFVVGSDGLPTTYDAVGLQNTFEGNFSYGCGVGMQVTSSLRTAITVHQSIGDSIGLQVFGTVSAPPAPVPKGTDIQGFTAISPANTGVLIEAGVIGLCIDGLDVSTGTSANGGITWNGNARLSNVVARDVGTGLTAHFIQQGSTGSGELNGFTAEVIAPGGDLMLISGELRVSGGNIDLDVPNAVPISVQAGGSLYMERVKLGGADAASAIVFAVASTGKLFFGPGNDFSACPFVMQITAGGVFATVQDRGLKTVNTTGGTTELTLLDSQVGTIKTTGVLASDATIVICGGIPAAGGNAPGLMVGALFALTNGNSGAHNTTFQGPSGVGFTMGAAAQGHTAMATINAAGDLVEVTGTG